MRINAHHYLHEIREAYAYIINKQKALEQYDYMLGVSGIDYNPDKVQTTPRQDGLERQAIRHLEVVGHIKLDIARKIEWRTKRIDEATDMISKIESKDQQDVLMMRYIEGMSWSDILNARGCDNLSSQYELHKRAIESLQKILDGDLIGS
jgi:hypothetical protein